MSEEYTPAQADVEEQIKDKSPLHSTPLHSTPLSYETTTGDTLQESDPEIEEMIQTAGNGNELEMPEISTHFYSPDKIVARLISKRFGSLRGLAVTQDELVTSGLLYVYEAEQLLSGLKNSGQWLSAGSQDPQAPERAFILAYVHRHLQKELRPLFRSRETSLEGTDEQDDSALSPSETLANTDNYRRSTEDTAITNVLLSECLRYAANNFSDREKQVFAGVLEGKDYTAIAAGSDLSTEQIKDAMKNVVVKLRTYLGINEDLPFPLFRDSTFKDLPPTVQKMITKVRKIQGDRQYHFDNKDDRNLKRKARRVTTAL